MVVEVSRCAIMGLEVEFSFGDGDIFSPLSTVLRRLPVLHPTASYGIGEMC